MGEQGAQDHLDVRPAPQSWLGQLLRSHWGDAGGQLAGSQASLGQSQDHSGLVLGRGRGGFCCRRSTPLASSPLTARRCPQVVEAWGRFPHRNAILGRQSSEAEQQGLREGTIKTW